MVRSAATGNRFTQVVGDLQRWNVHLLTTKPTNFLVFLDADTRQVNREN